MKLNIPIWVFLLSMIISNAACRKGKNEAQPEYQWETISTPYCGKPQAIQFVTADTGYILGIHKQYIIDPQYFDKDH